MIGILACFALSAMNAALYVAAGHHWWSLSACIFCGLCGLGLAILEAGK